MKYEDFPKFIEEFNQIRSFKRKIDFTNEHLQRIGSGSGRIVYDIDDEKVFKLAKNTKGIAQNEAEAGAGYYRDTLHIVTEVYDSADDYSWIVSEKAKKVTEKRIKELTGIPTLQDLFYFLRNNESQNKGRGKIFSQDKEVEESFWENEFASDLMNFVVNYGQTTGDMGRPSSYGEVLRDGQPAIVLTDYGLNDEVYDTHYSPQRKQRHQMYELYGFHDGNDDILSDIGNVGANERHGMWGLMPYSVSDGPGVINEKFIDFVSKRDKYPKKLIQGLPFLTDCFHECVNNIKETLNTVDNKKQFFNNLLVLQEYLVEQGYYNRDPLMKEKYVINEDIPAVEMWSLGDKEYANKLAQQVAGKLNLGNLSYLGSGGFGFAYAVNNKVVLKLTSDLGEADAALIVLRNKPKTLAEIYNIYKIVDTETNQAFFAILQENIINKPVDRFVKIEQDIQELSPEFDYQDYLASIRKRNKFDYNQSVEYAKSLLTINPEANISQANREAVYNHVMGINNIRKELIDLGIKSTDYVANVNLGYSNGILKFFDVGGHIEPEPDVGKNVITLPENVNEDQVNEDYPRDRADAVAVEIGKKLGVEPHYLGHGFFGVAYDIGDNKILKITGDNSEAVENLKLIGKPLKYIAQPYKVFKVESTSNSKFPKTYVIILEKLKTDITYFERMNNRLDYVFKTIFDTDYKDVLEVYLYGHQFDNDINKDELDHYFKKNSEDADFFFGILRIAEELDKYGIKSTEYCNPYNLGYKKSGALALFDVGFSDGWLQPTDVEKMSVNVDEDGSSKFSTDSEFGQDGFPPYNQGDDNSPMVKNDLDANSAMYGNDNMDEDLEYNHVKGDATDDAYMLTENILSDKEYSVLDKEYPIINGNEINGLLIRNEIPNKSSISSTLENYEILKGLREVRWSTEKPKYYSVEQSERTKQLAKEIEFNKEINPLIVEIDKNNEPYIIEGSHRVDALTELGIYSFPALVVIDLDARNKLAEDRKKAWMPGSQAVTVKKKCRLGGLPDGTSVACNQGDINNLEFTSLTEEDETNEGVGDKYAEKKFGIEPEFSSFEKDLNVKQSEENIIYRDDKGWGIVKNPVSLTNLGNGVRGIITRNGDLYLELHSEKIHKNIIDVLHEKRLIRISYMDSFYDYIPTEYMTVQRDGETNDILVGESNDAMQDDKNMYGDWRTSLKVPSKEEVIPEFQKFMDIAKRKHPKINFINEHISVYRRAKYINEDEMVNETNIMQLTDIPFKSEIEQLGGKIYSVGGAVRDEFLGKESKDLDILVTGIPMDKLGVLMSKYGKVDAVGKQFGVLKFRPPNGEEIDVAIPRTETPTSAGGHKGFDVQSDHALPIEKDLERRDFTINAIAKDIDGNIIDPYHGQEDLKNKIIKVVNPEAFSDDPLRMLRAVQFASRFGFEIEPETRKMIKANAQRIKEISPERILIEFDKIVKKGDKMKGAFLLKDLGLTPQIFGADAGLYVGNEWEKVQTMGEFLWLLSNHLVDNVADFYKNNLKGDIDTYKELKALQHAFNSGEESDISKARTAAHNVYVTANNMLQSQILPEAIRNAANDLLSGKYPKSLKELAINGADLKQIGFPEGKQIGDMLKQLLVKIYGDEIRNDREELLSLTQQGLGNLNEGWDNYENPVWEVNGEMVDVEFFVKEYDIWNTQGGEPGYEDPSRESVLEFLQNNYEDFSKDERLKRELYWTLTDRDLLTEREEKVEYGALMLFLDVPVWEKITSVIKKEDIYEKDGEFGIETEPHVTILYGFHANVNADDVFDLYKENFELKPIEIGVEGISVFESEEFDVVKMDVSSKILPKMNSVMRELPNTTTFPKYHAHITLAYVKKGRGKDYIKAFEKNRILVGNELVFSTKKEKHSKLKLDEKGVLKENKEQMKRVSYSAVVLDDKSRATLIKVFHPMIPEGWKIYAHHMTIKLGALEDGSQEQQDMLDEKMVTLDVVDYAIDDKVMAVGVKGYSTTNTKPHVTIAVNTAEGGKPFLSNKLIEWRPLGFPLELTGKVSEE